MLNAGFGCCIAVCQTGALRCAGVSPRLFFTLAEHGLDTLTVLWHSALNSALLRVPDRLLVLVAASHEPQGPNLYLQSPGMGWRWGVAKGRHRGSQRGQVNRCWAAQHRANKTPRYSILLKKNSTSIIFKKKKCHQNWKLVVLHVSITKCI